MTATRSPRCPRGLRVRDTYGVDVLDEADSVLVLSVTVAVDALAHD